MKALKESTHDELEEVAMLGCKAIRAALTYQGENPAYYQKGKLGSIAVTNFTRARATESNRMAVELMAQRQTAKPLIEAAAS